MRCSGKITPSWNCAHSRKCRARVEALVAADPEVRLWLGNARKRRNFEKYMEWRAKRAEAGAEPSSRDRGAEPSEDQTAPSPPEATAAAGSAAVPVQGEGGAAEDEARGIALRLVKLESAE